MAARIASWIAAALVVIVALWCPATVSATPTHYPHQRCATNAEQQSTLDLKSKSALVGTRPWGLVYYNETLAFAASNFSLVVLNTARLRPRVMGRVPLPSQNMGNDDPNEDGYGYREIALSNDKRTLYLATGYGAAIVDVDMAIAGRQKAVVGVLSSKGTIGRSAIDVSITPDDKHVFISQEFGSPATGGRGAVEVYAVNRLENGTVEHDWIGFIALGYATIGQQFSPDFTKLYVTSEMYDTGNSTGLLAVLDVGLLTTSPGDSLLNRVRAGCRPVRCYLSDNGKQLWVTERDANQLSVYDAEMLAVNTSRTDDVVEGTVSVGTSPIGITGVGHYIITADSNRFNYTNATSGLTVINSRAVLGQISIINNPQIQTNMFPRSLAVSPSGNRLLVSEFGSGTIRAINTTLLNREVL